MTAETETQDPRTMILQVQRNDEIRARLRRLTELRGQKREMMDRIETAKSTVKLLDLSLEKMAHELCRLGNMEDNLDGMQTLIA